MRNVNHTENIDFSAAVKTKFIKLFSDESFTFDSGEQLMNIDIAYQTYGKLNDSGNNAILICHALTGNAHAAGKVKEEELENSISYTYLYKYNKMYLDKPGWWDPLIGKGKTFDTDKYFVICSNILGSCYGSSGPASINTASGKPYQRDFPPVSVRDMVKIQKSLLEHLGISKLLTVAGGSLGGMQVLEWAAMYPEMLESIIPIATSAAHSPWAMALNKTAKEAICNDPEWRNGYYENQPINGLSLARKIAMISYRSYVSFERKFGRKIQHTEKNKNVYSIESYLDYQGEKLVKRFDANTYLYLADAMDSHDLGRDRGSIENILENIETQALCIGIDSDILYPAEEQKYIAGNLRNSEYREINSPHGHDAFLIEFDQLERIIKPFLSKIKKLAGK